MDDYNFIMLDALAGHRGGVSKLNINEQLAYISLGFDQGFLTLEEAYDLAKKLKIENDPLFKNIFGQTDKDHQ